ncbi:hypothetical protein FKR81_10560 [Lentzea tibetensis]|uniref:SH3 domain-containing protein n=1 Tax=Lentzea tibetensis TaxID=2591470 RepID=A0A563EWJ0_9PSEU|nr:hypothetical protein [Lentzea tibetensis]TWP52023.1 hypothetical protein FKR81_10560 [Lentzea tibetensis]
MRKTAMVASALAVLGTVVFASPAHAEECGGGPDGLMWCGNATTPVWAQAAFDIDDRPVPIVDTLYASPRSWFSCYRQGQWHSGNNNIWYQTRGDVNGRTGYVPASAVNSRVDPGPGLKHC